MDLDTLVGAVLRHLPTASDAVIYGSLALAAAAVSAIAFFGIVGSYYRTTSPLVPPTKAAAAALLLLAPLAALLVGLGMLAERHPDFLFLSFFSPALVVACLCGTPLLLWLPAAALTAYPPFREMHMPADPEAEAGAGGEAGGGHGLDAAQSSSLSAASGGAPGDRGAPPPAQPLPAEEGLEPQAGGGARSAGEPAVVAAAEPAAEPAASAGAELASDKKED